jgi:hypothetical protein
VCLPLDGIGEHFADEKRQGMGFGLSNNQFGKLCRIERVLWMDGEFSHELCLSFHFYSVSPYEEMLDGGKPLCHVKSKTTYTIS